MRLALAALILGTAASAEAAETITYQYDARGRLVQVSRSGSVNNGVNTSYAHDKANNRTGKTTTGSPNPPPP
jgi:YD repeat-containing protein